VLYPVALLKLCLQKTPNEYRLEPASVAMQQGRSLRMLTAGKEIDVMWTVTSNEREAELLPIRIPIDRGLIGWRLLLIRQKDAERFADIHNAAQLAPLYAGQGHDWPDLTVLTSNGFHVTASTTYDGLFYMLARKHIDYFPRSITEVTPELSAHAELKLAVESRLLIHYPAALYYFVNKENTGLAATIEEGLQIAIADGSMQELFDSHYAESIKQHQLTEHTLIELQNPSLPSATPLNDPRYWLQREDFQ